MKNLVARLEIEYPQSKANKAKFCKEYGTNSIYAGKHWSKRAKDKEYWHLLIMQAMQKANIKKSPVNYPVDIFMTFDDGLDCDNHSYICKMAIDSIKGYVIHDDNFKYIKAVTLAFNHENKITMEIVKHG